MNFVLYIVFFEVLYVVDCLLANWLLLAEIRYNSRVLANGEVIGFFCLHKVVKKLVFPCLKFMI